MTIPLPVAVNNVDSVNGGILRLGLQDFVFIKSLVALQPELVATVGWVGDSHDPCPFPPTHCEGAWAITEGSPLVFIVPLIAPVPIPIARLGDPASCGDSVDSGSIFVMSD